MGCTIEFEGITNAIKARDLLRQSRFKAVIQKNSKSTKKGCSYTVNTSADCDTAGKALEIGSIRANRYF